MAAASESRRVLVTGASGGIGSAIAERLARDGFAVTLHYRSGREAAESLAGRIRSAGGEAELLQFDVSDREQCRQVLEDTLTSRGPYYGIVCNAGIARDNAFPALEDEDWDRVMDTNLDGMYNVLKPLVMPLVRTRAGGRIVTISSVSGMVGNRGQVNYSAAKAGIIGATKALAQELAKRRITVNCVAPGLIETDMIADAPVEEALKLIPAARLGRPEEVAAAVSFLMSDEAGYVTRQVIAVNGGMC
jgi:3-oxoacyl-[acyl-carrier protein] reductase